MQVAAVKEFEVWVAEEQFDESLPQVGLVCSTARGVAGVRLADLLGLPRNGCERAELSVRVIDLDDPSSPSVWVRTFGRRSWRSVVTLNARGELIERLGPFVGRFAVEVTADSLELRSMAIRFGSIARLPVSVLVSVKAAGDATLTTVEIDMRRFGQLRYVTTMRDCSSNDLRGNGGRS